MTTYVFTDPSGKEHEVTGPAGATKEQAFQVLQSQLAQPRPPVNVPPMNVDPSEGMGPLDKALVGAGAAFDRAGRGISGLVRSVARATGLEGPIPVDPQGVEDAALYRKHHPGGWATAGEIGADVAMSAIPVAKGGQVLTQTLGKLGRAAPMVGDVAANAAYSAATAPEDRGTAAAWGAGGATAGRVLARTLGGAITPTKEAQALMDQGVRLTPGQAAGKDHFANRVEQWASSNPIGALAIAPARARALEDANQAAAHAVVRHVDDTVKLGRPPSEAIEQVRDRISNVYDEVLPNLQMPHRDLISLADQIARDVPANAVLVGKKQAGKLVDYLDRRILDNGNHMDDMASGEFLKQVDSELGSYARTLAKSTNAEEKIAAPMWYQAQGDWREYVMKAAAPDGEDFARLGKANTAYRQLLALEKALKASGGERMTPRNLAKSLEASNVKTGDLTDLSRNMTATLPNTVPNSGTADRLLANALPSVLMGGGALGQHYGFDPYGLSTGMLAAGALGSRTGAKMMTGQTFPQRMLVEALRKGGKLTPEQAKQRAAAMAAQMGRAAATGQR